MTGRGARITFLGDTLLGGEAQATLDRRGYRSAFDGIRHVLSDSDLVVANLEGPVADHDEAESKLDTGRKRYWYRARSESVAALRDEGVRVVSLANNHVCDFGAEALAQTIAELRASGISTCGAGVDRRDARRPAIVDISGMRVGFVSAMQRYDLYVAEDVYARRDHHGPMRLDARRMRRDLERLATRCGLPVALMHWGRNYRKRNPRQVRLARMVVGAGAGLIIGHHPHVVQPIEVVDGVVVCYSLGNGPLGTPGRFHSGRPPFGLIASVDLDQDARPVRLWVTPIRVDNSVVEYRPVIADTKAELDQVRRLIGPSLDWTLHDEATFVADMPARSASTGSVEATRHRSL